MKKLNFLGFLLLIASVSYTTSGQSQLISEITITPPAFQAANSDNLSDYFQTFIEYPANSLDRGLQGTEVVRFAVTSSGKIEDIAVINSVSKEIDNEVVLLLKNTSGRWMPGTVDGEPQKMSRELSLAFVLDSYNEMQNTARKYVQKGHKLAFVKNKPKRALKYFNKAAMLFPNETGVLFMQKYCLEKLGRDAEADKARERLEYQAMQYKPHISPMNNEYIFPLEPVAIWASQTR